MHALLANVGRAAAGLGVDGNAELLAQDLELLDGGRAVHVGGHEQRPLVLLLEVTRQLADGRRLARALQADQHDARRALLREPEARLDGAHELDELVVAQLDEVVLGRDAPDLLFRRSLDLDDDADGPLSDALAEILHDVEADVGLEQRRADVLERLVDGGLVELGEPLEPLLGVAKALRERLEHGRGI